MKTRNGFVSNSSSSSFIINKKYLSSNQIELIKNHLEETRKTEQNDHMHCYDEWYIEETDNSICGRTDMDNFDMRHYLMEVVDVDLKHIEMDL